MSSKPRRLIAAFVLGALLGAVIGAIWGTLDYGAFEIGYLYNYVLGFGLITGFTCLALMALFLWKRQNPL
ncbi:nitrate reductase [Chelativorans alearense]|uniref:nitrate reductase n=1 Tax=Chelativorans alearense TaxID=2681495 RepID=UPI0013D20D2B|nr:nitrate reductase [Chelativorans alearense]